MARIGNTVVYSVRGFDDFLHSVPFFLFAISSCKRLRLLSTSVLSSEQRDLPQAHVVQLQAVQGKCWARLNFASDSELALLLSLRTHNPIQRASLLGGRKCLLIAIPVS